MATSGTLLAGGLVGRLATARMTTAGITSAGTPMRVGTVALTVRDLDTVSRFYQQVIGLARIDAAPDLVRLGVGTTVLLDLHHDPDARLANRREAGLFHTAFLLPSRADLAQWLLHAVEQRVPLHGASDHGVSEAIYLADPEGNGIEIYHDRPSETWAWHDGMIRMETLPLDLDALAASVQTRNWSGLPDGSCIGHVHLRVGELQAAESFYTRLLGLDVTSRISGATFLSSGGYHHHLATNIWNSRGAVVRSQPMTGVANLKLVAEAAVLDAVRSRLAPEQAAQGSAAHLSLSDPWGTEITLVRG